LLSAQVPFSHHANISSPPLVGLVEHAQHAGRHSNEWVQAAPGAERVVFGVAHPVASVIKSGSPVRTMTLLSAAPGEHSVPFWHAMTTAAGTSTTAPHFIIIAKVSTHVRMNRWFLPSSVIVNLQSARPPSRHFEARPRNSAHAATTWQSYAK
jgi:hypothetical protein